MKAVRIEAFGGPEQVALEEIELPSLTRGKALIRVHAAAVNPVDWMIREQIYNPPGADRVPMTLGQDFAGTIARIGPGSSTSFKVGDAVFGEAWGTFAEYALVPLKDLVRKPKGLDFVTAASIPMPALTAWQAIIDTAGVKRGMRVLIHGAAGGVGSFAAQFAKWRGAYVAATASRSSFSWLRSIGIDLPIDYKRSRFEKQVCDMDVVLDPIGGEVQARSWAVLRKGGMLINLIGENNERAARKAGVKAVEFGMEYDTEDLAEIAKLMEKGTIKPHISRVMPLRQAARALNMNQQGDSHGKIILEVGA